MYIQKQRQNCFGRVAADGQNVDDEFLRAPPIGLQIYNRNALQLSTVEVLDNAAMVSFKTRFFKVQSFKYACKIRLIDGCGQTSMLDECG